jgi:integrase
MAVDGDSTRPKRGHGEGTINQRPDGVWRGRIMVGSQADGTPDRRSVTAATRGEVQKKLRELKRQAEGGLLVDRAKRETLAAFLDRWLDGAKASVRATTHARYVQLLHAHVFPTLGRKPLESLRPDDVQRLYADLLQKAVGGRNGRRVSLRSPAGVGGATLSPGTVHHVHVVLHIALEKAVKWGYVPRNVCDVVDAPRVQQREMHPPTAVDVAALLDAAGADPLLTLWTLAAYTGARQGELLGLQWSDLDLDAGALTIQRTLLQTTRGGIPAYAPPKTAKSRRTIALPEEAVDALRQHRQQQLADRLTLGSDYAGNNLVFATALGTPLLHSNVHRSFKAALTRAGLAQTVRFHDLRHAHATSLRAGGIDLKTVSERLGHSNIGITGDLYTHAVAQADRDAATMLQTLIRGARRKSEPSNG